LGADPIIGLDATPDEHWIVATCPYYISVFNVYAPSTRKLGFDAPMGKDKPALSRLAIKGEHQQQVAQYFKGEMPAFAPAKFEMKSGKPVSIVAAIGTGLVVWDFAKIEAGCLPSYAIKLVGREMIVDDQPLPASFDLVFISDNQVSVVERRDVRRRH
jgi:hypothetical protein